MASYFRPNKRKKHGKEAIEILEMMGYFNSSDIDSEMFSGLIQDDEILGSAIRLLKQYSMVNSGERENIFNIHKLVQQVIRLNLKNQGKEEKVLRKALELIESNSPNYRADDLVHTMSVWEYVGIYSNLVNRFEYLLRYIVERLRFLLRYREAKTFGTKVLNFLEEDSFDAGEIHYQVALANSRLGENETAINDLEKLYDKKVFSKAPINGSRLITSIAKEYCAIRLDDIALKCCDQALLKLSNNEEALFYKKTWSEYLLKKGIKCERDRGIVLQAVSVNLLKIDIY